MNISSRVSGCLYFSECGCRCRAYTHRNWWTATNKTSFEYRHDGLPAKIGQQTNTTSALLTTLYVSTSLSLLVGSRIANVLFVFDKAQQSVTKGTNVPFQCGRWALDFGSV